MPLHPQTIIVITGTTCTGKSSLAVRLCKKLQEYGIETEIISADSISIYEGFRIGTASLSLEEQKGIPHHLLHVEDPRVNFTAGEFVRRAAPIINELHKKNKTPIIVGGSGFYLRALTQGMIFNYAENKEEKEKINKSLLKEIKEKGLTFLYEKMLQKDPALKESIHPNDEYRIIRALEVMESSNEKWSILNKKAKELPARYPHTISFFLYLDKKILRKHVMSRSKKMLQEGLLEEVQKLLREDIPIHSKAFQSVGYRECLEYLGLKKSIPEDQKPTTMEELEEKIARETMRLAKNQMTWSRGQKQNLKRLDAKSDCLKNILENLDLNI